MNQKHAILYELGTREIQQDTYTIKNQGNQILAIVCDGMGGMQAGERASQVAAEKMKNDFKSHAPIKNVPQFFQGEVQTLDDLVFSITDMKGRRLNAGTTIAAAILDNKKLFWLSIGDSEIFVVRENELVTVNVKHNYKLQLDEMLAEDKISLHAYTEEMIKGNQLISYLGMGGELLYDSNSQPLYLQKGDYICLCSDGVSNTISKTEILQLIHHHKDVNSIVEEMKLLIRNNRMEQDNATAILIKLE